MKEKLFKAYVRYIRPFTEQWLNSIYHKDTPFDYWGLVKDLPMQKFSDKINAYVYKMDKLGGLLDHAMFFETPNQFFVERDSNRDCFLADVPLLVKTDDGIDIKSFEEIYKLFKIGAHLSVLDRNFQWIPVLNMVEKTTNKSSLLFFGVNGILAVTEEHPIYNGETFEIAKTANPHTPSFDYSHVLTSNVGTLQNENAELLWALGFFCADGYAMQKRKGGAKHIILTNTNEAYILRALAVLNDVFGGCFKKTNYPSDEQGCVRGGVTLRNKQHKIIFSAKTLPKEQRQVVMDYFLSFYSTTHEKKVPAWVFTASKKGIASFLDGYWCGNGYKGELLRKESTVPTKSLAMQLKLLYTLIDYQRTSIRRDGDKNAYTVSATYNNTSNNGVHYMNKKKIETSKKVYDITVLGGEFLVDNYLVHNCDNFARIWSIWAIYHGYEYQEVIVTTKQRIIRDSHVVTAIHINNYWYLCDYTPYGLYSTKDEAIEDIVNHWEKYTEDNLLYEYYYGRH